MTNREPQIVVIGTGYVGLTTAACLAHLGHDVVGVDVDEAKVWALRRGEVPIVEAGLVGMVSRGLESGRLRFETSYEHAAGDVVLLCLPTPTTAAGDLDLSYIESAARQLRDVLEPGAIVVTKSTVPVGTHRDLLRWLDRPDLAVASNPEFLREGTAVHDFCHPDRVVIGAADVGVAERVAGLYRSLSAPILITDLASAELVKVAANTFLAAKLSFVNEMSRVCEATGGDIDEVIAGIASDHRIGTAFMRPGPGWGGSCFPKDTRGMAALGRQHGLELPMVTATIASNDAHMDHIDLSIRTSLGRPLADATVAVWGATFKAGTDDCRDSPALAIVRRLAAAGARIRLFDPVARPSVAGVEHCGDAYDACDNADLLVIATEWPEFGEADMNKVARLLAAPTVFDTRGILDPAAVAAAGLILHRPGHGASWAGVSNRDAVGTGSGGPR